MVEGKERTKHVPDCVFQVALHISANPPCAIGCWSILQISAVRSTGSGMCSFSTSVCCGSLAVSSSVLAVSCSFKAGVNCLDTIMKRRRVAVPQFFPAWDSIPNSPCNIIKLSINYDFKRLTRNRILRLYLRVSLHLTIFHE